MFVQVIRGRTDDAEAVRRQFDRWTQDLKPGAAGYLGTTGGVTDDGELVVIARFEDEESARRNSDRPEQGSWWQETSKYIQGATFSDSTEVDLLHGGGSNDAGFVQVMQGRATDKAALKALEAEFESRAKELRPDLLGGITAWQGDAFTQAAYFTSEADARENEARSSGDEAMTQFTSLVTDLTFLDLRSPFLS